MIEEIIVLGAGAIGSTLGTLLSKKFNVLFVSKDKEHVREINENGLRLSREVNEVFKVKAVEEIKEIKPNTLIINTTKSFDAANAVKNIRKLLKDDTIILCLQNGLGAVEEVKKETNCRVFAGVTYIGAIFNESGNITVASMGKTILEESSETKEIARMFNDLVPFETSTEFKTIQWQKLTINCMINPLGALLNVVNKKIAVDELKEVRKGIANECRRIAEKEGVNLSEEFIEKTSSIISSFKSNKCSMLQDINAERKTEIDYINGAIEKLGKKHGIETPVNSALVSMIKFKENNK